MGKMTGLLAASVGLLVLLAASGVDSQSSVLKSCKKLMDCLKLIETSCNAEGKRLVCLKRVDTGSCDAEVYPGIGPNDTAKICLENTFDIEDFHLNTPVCVKNLVPGGASFSFGIQAEFDTNEAANGEYRLAGGGKATCEGYKSVCEHSGFNDFKITVRTQPCPATTTTTATTTKVPGCKCYSWQDTTVCSSHCGYGHKMQTRSCHGCPAGTATSRSVSCKIKDCPSSTTKKPLIHGSWSPYGPWTTCPPKNCHGLYQERTRLCDNPAPAYGGSYCPGPSREYRPCVCGGGGDKKAKRECKRAAKKKCPRGPSRRKCIRKECREFFH